MRIHAQFPTAPSVIQTRIPAAADCRRRSCHRRGGPVDKQLRERLQQHSPEDRPGAVRLHLAPTARRLPEAKQVAADRAAAELTSESR